MHEIEKWPDHLQTELNHEREKHRTQMIELERRLKENFATVCQLKLIEYKLNLIFRN